MSGIKYFNAGGQPLRLDDLAQILKISLDTRGIITTLMKTQGSVDPLGNPQCYWLVKPTYTVDGTPGNYTYTFTNGSVISSVYDTSAICNMDMGTTDNEELYPILHTEIYEIPHYILTGVTSSGVTNWYPYVSEELEMVTMYNLTEKPTYNKKTLFFLPESHGFSSFNYTLKVLKWDYQLIDKTYTLIDNGHINGYNNILPFENLIYNNIRTILSGVYYSKTEMDTNLAELKYKTFNIGDWNMSGSTQKTIQTQTLYGINAYNIRNITIQIIPDTGSPMEANIYPLEYTDYASSDTESGGSYLLGGTNSLILIIHQDGFFQRNMQYFANTSFNRGYVTVGYLE